jgi:hypothetical protein
MFRRVVSSNGLTFRLDYTMAVTDEMVAIPYRRVMKELL